MPRPRFQPTRADLPAELTPESLRPIPLNRLRWFSRPGNGVLDEAEQKQFDEALHTMMSQTSGRLEQQLSGADWHRIRSQIERREASKGRRRPNRADQQLRRLTEQIDQQLDVAEDLAPGVDWSFAPSGASEPAPIDAPENDDADDTGDTGDTDDAGSQTVADLEDRLAEQTEMVSVLADLADVTHRTYDLEQERDLQNTRSVFFGFVVSVTVIVAGWAPIVAAHDWAERWQIIGLTLATVVVAGTVYALVRAYQKRHQPDDDTT